MYEIQIYVVKYVRDLESQSPKFVFLLSHLMLMVELLGKLSI